MRLAAMPQQNVPRRPQACTAGHHYGQGNPQYYVIQEKFIAVGVGMVRICTYSSIGIYSYILHTVSTVQYSTVPTYLPVLWKATLRARVPEPASYAYRT